MSNPLEFEDRQLTCGDCGQQFTWPAAEQAFFNEKGFEPPKRCKECRQANKERREAGRRTAANDE